VAEYRLLLTGIPYELLTPADLGLLIAVVETGSTFEANARLKATAFARESGVIALADDSGLEVDVLGGAPGPLSARYAGETATDKQRIDLLLRNLACVPWEKRTARFRCVIAIASPQVKVEVCFGTCEGYVTFEPRGEHGFGYDPIFFLPEYGKTMAEIPATVKNEISHRARAARQVSDALSKLTIL
jgi:XTP/dITP diphosphohydrolase